MNKTVTDNKIQCLICAHQCLLAERQWGRCKVRTIQNGQLKLITYGKVIAASLDPIEKKPLRQFNPGSKVYTIATPGCTLGCKFCQNWEIALGVDEIDLDQIDDVSPEQVVQTAISAGADGIAFSYTEPVVSFEYTLDVMKQAKQAGLFNVWHTNGYLTQYTILQTLEWLDAACIDLKAATEETYHQLTGGSLLPVITTAREFKQAGIWVEVSTPILAGINDDRETITQLAELIIYNLGLETPWHLMRGHPAWKMSDIPFTAISTMKLAETIARNKGLKFIYPTI